jgi:uncharacterized lipoprotein YajG
MNHKEGAQKAGQVPARSAMFWKMKKLFAGLAAALLLAGCAHRYDLTLTNGIRVTNISKPVLDRQAGVYTYKDITGRRRQIPASRVEVIEPHSNKKVTNQFGQ